jgi:GNAT superfamily N-acetyltransferase
MFIRWQFRGKGLGRASALKIIEEAKKIGYKKLRLDTLPQMTSAIVLYLSLDFKEIPPYRFNPIKGAKFFELAIPS